MCALYRLLKMISVPFLSFSLSLSILLLFAFQVEIALEVMQLWCTPSLAQEVLLRGKGHISSWEEVRTVAFLSILFACFFPEHFILYSDSPRKGTYLLWQEVRTVSRLSSTRPAVTLQVFVSSLHYVQ